MYGFILIAILGVGAQPPLPVGAGTWDIPNPVFEVAPITANEAPTKLSKLRVPATLNRFTPLDRQALKNRAKLLAARYKNESDKDRRLFVGEGLMIYVVVMLPHIQSPYLDGEYAFVQNTAEDAAKAYDRPAPHLPLPAPTSKPLPSSAAAKGWYWANVSGYVVQVWGTPNPTQPGGVDCQYSEQTPHVQSIWPRPVVVTSPVTPSAWLSNAILCPT